MDLRPMELKDTVDLMVSPDYNQRFEAELYQLKIRYGDLREIVRMWDEGILNFTPTCPRSIYDLQLRAMKDYIAVLEARARIEGVELHD